MGIESKIQNLLSGETGAVLSGDRKYRYALWRRWSSKPYVLFVGLNPSTADEKEDDPTIRRCKTFARDWGYGAVVMVNLFAIRATDPKDMMAYPHPVGGDNNVWLQDLAKNADEIVCAWGANGSHQERGQYVAELLEGYDLKCLGVTKAGHPRHPLYIKSDKALDPYKPNGK